jgi:hypothetical protein
MNLQGLRGQKEENRVYEWTTRKPILSITLCSRRRMTIPLVEPLVLAIPVATTLLRSEKLPMLAKAGVMSNAPPTPPSRP